MLNTDIIIASRTAFMPNCPWNQVKNVLKRLKIIIWHLGHRKGKNKRYILTTSTRSVANRQSYNHIILFVGFKLFSNIICIQTFVILFIIIRNLYQFIVHCLSPFVKLAKFYKNNRAGSGSMSIYKENWVTWKCIFSIENFRLSQ